MTNASDARETGTAFLPKFDANGLLAGIAIDAETREVLMMAFMDAAAVQVTLDTGFAHFHSRSRGRLWKKGESSGNVLRVIEVRVDCDQDTLLLICEAAGPACHTGAPTCFYRKIEGGGLVPA